jgi:hypothetical protein
MMEANDEDDWKLTEREQQALDYMRKAQEPGLTLKEYASRSGLDVQKLY